MGNLKRDYHRFIYKHRSKGIPNLMTWICGINAVVFILHYFFKLDLILYCYMNPDMVMQGQVWRLFTYVFTFACEETFLGSGLLGGIVSISLYLWIGRVLESTWGTLRFNIFYFTGLLIQNLYAMLIFWIFQVPGTYSAHFLNMAMFLAIATLLPDQRIFIMAVIPVKMKWAAWISLGFTTYSIIRSVYNIMGIAPYASFGFLVGCILFLLYPLVALINYVIFLILSPKERRL